MGDGRPTGADSSFFQANAETVVVLQIQGPPSVSPAHPLSLFDSG